MEGVGVDIVEIERISNIIEKRRDKFFGRVFTEQELSYCLNKSNPAPSLAARFAAKEAVLKAMGKGLGACPLNNIGVINDPGGQPKLELTGSAKELSETLGFSTWYISLSHSKNHAVAMVMAKG